ncbi:NADH-quinone oxidoreductase subunit C [Candidatus Kaiserbacteria bacterium]|nr:NADH-quinone oxidoreductase subunit C [Candidatus Kaiserbacteria bacterium]
MKNQTGILSRYLPGRTSELSGNAIIVPIENEELRNAFATLETSLPFLTMFATEEGETFGIHYVFGLPGEGVPHEKSCIVLRIEGSSFPSLAREFPMTALYERLIMTMFGAKAEGHPDPRPLTLHEENWPMNTHPMRKNFKWDTRVPETKSGEYDFNRVGGEGVYEIPVGPVHAGIIEPGHFRFSVAGEEIIALEARLGWVHKGVEKLFENLALEKHLKLAEHISGDSSFSHSLAYCEALETLTKTALPERARYLRLVYAELERLTMHIFDIGNTGGNGTGFSFLAAHGFRMVEELRRLSASLSGNRFLRGLNIPGGVSRDLQEEDVQEVAAFLAHLKEDFSEMMEVADTSASLANRLQGTGTLSAQIARENHAVGIAARCVGISKDVRLEYPYAAYKELKPEIALESAGDVDARFRIRVKEVYESIRLIEKALRELPGGPISTPIEPLPHKGLSVRAVEGWRGEIVYAIVANEGTISRVAVRDPSFIHWQLFPHLVTSDMVPDFPLINKSFNLSYTGNDL